MSQDLAKAVSMIEVVADDIYEGRLNMDHPAVIDMMYKLRGAFRLYDRLDDCEGSIVHGLDDIADHLSHGVLSPLSAAVVEIVSDFYKENEQ